jgi:hypothetical protein
MVSFKSELTSKEASNNFALPVAESASFDYQ